jgi:glycosyltransferase involved in cell wall biosynthesis
MKILFVAHTLKLGGAERSLRELVRNLDGVVCDLVVPWWSRQSDDEIRAMFGPSLRRVERAWLPFDLCYRGRPPIHRAIHRYLGTLLWRLGRRRLEARIARERYDAIHLNSVTLHPMVRARLPFIVHVREIVDIHHARVARSLAAARGVIFIDRATQAPFSSLETPSTVMNNPFAMRAPPVPTDAAARMKADPADVTVFAIIGMLIPEKGVDRVIRAFRGVGRSDARLLVVGRGRDRSRLERLARGDDRIVFWGEDQEIERVYALTDYVIRGEATFAVGRTIYEGLYAGSEVILPSRPEDEVFDRERFADRIHVYTPGDGEALRAVMERLAGRKISRQPPLSNVDEYVEKFLSFVRENTDKGAG